MKNKTKKAIGTLAAEVEQIEKLITEFESMNANCEQALKNLGELKCKK